MDDMNEKSGILCEHANEMSNNCRCDKDCYCKQHSCRPKITCYGVGGIEYTNKYISECQKVTSVGGINDLSLTHKVNDALPNPMWGGMPDGGQKNIMIKTTKHKKFLVTVRVGVIDLHPKDIQQYMEVSAEKFKAHVSFLTEEYVDAIFIPSYKSKETSVHILNLETMQKVVL